MKSLTEILNLPGNSEIPRDIEDVTLHVIEKIAKSNNSTELKSGGPWVMLPKDVRKPGPY